MTTTLRILLLHLLAIATLHDNAHRCCGTDLPTPPPPRSDIYCGPRVAAQLLKYHDPTAEAATLTRHFIRQTHNSKGFRQGWSLQQIAEKLSEHGMSCSSLRVNDAYVPRSQYPLILHLSPLHSESLGHFAILLPTVKDDIFEVWIGVDGTVEWSSSDLRSFMSGAILVAVPKTTEPHSDISSLVNYELVNPIAPRPHELFLLGSGFALGIVVLHYWKSMPSHHIRDILVDAPARSH